VIVGYTQKKRVVSSLVLGLYDKNKKLHYVGKVGTGFTQKFLHDLYPKLKKLEVQKPSVINPVDKSIQWVKPKLVGEIAFLEMTKVQRLRAPSFKRLRDDKKPIECTFEQ
jgi:bifunctional non-homologous end joining protein LigD